MLKRGKTQKIKKGAKYKTRIRREQKERNTHTGKKRKNKLKKYECK